MWILSWNEVICFLKLMWILSWNEREFSLKWTWILLKWIQNPSWNEHKFPLEMNTNSLWNEHEFSLELNVSTSTQHAGRMKSSHNNWCHFKSSLQSEMWLSWISCWQSINQFWLQSHTCGLLLSLIFWPPGGLCIQKWINNCNKQKLIFLPTIREIYL